MSLEQQIKDLQRLLALKTAYSKVLVTFDEKDDIPEDVKIEVVTKLASIAHDLGADIEPAVKNQNSQFTEIEVDVLKNLAESVLERAKKQSSSPSSTALPTIKDQSKELFAILLTTNNVRKEQRKYVNSNERVQVLKYDDVNALITNKSGERFIVLKDDIELENQ